MWGLAPGVVCGSIAVGGVVGAVQSGLEVLQTNTSFEVEGQNFV